MNELELVEAVKSGSIEAVKELIESGAEVNHQDKQGWTPLNWAAGKGNLQLIELLLQHGADPLAVGRDLRTPQLIALAAGHAEAVKLLRQAEAKANGGQAEQQEREYCAAYRLEDIRRYFEQNENSAEQAGEHQNLAADDIVFLHHDYKVTKSMWPNEDVIFADESQQWKDFCTNELQFAVPDSLDLIPKPAEAGQNPA